MVMFINSRADSRYPFNQEKGFTLVELAVTVILLGLILTIGALSYANIRKGMNMSGAKKQVEEALQRAKTAARQENIDYWLAFYPGDGSNPSTYEFYHNEYKEDPANGTMIWEKTPVDKSVSGESVMEDAGHWYVKVPHGVQVSSEHTILFNPEGTVMKVTPATTINLEIGDAGGSVSISESGTITVN